MVAFIDGAEQVTVFSSSTGPKQICLLAKGPATAVGGSIARAIVYNRRPYRDMAWLMGHVLGPQLFPDRGKAIESLTAAWWQW